MNPLSEDPNLDEWAEALGSRSLAYDLALIDRALYGLQAINRMLAANHTEAQEEDKAESMELNTYLVGGLCAAAESLATLAHLRMAEIKDRAGRKPKC